MGGTLRKMGEDSPLVLQNVSKPQHALLGMARRWGRQTKVNQSPQTEKHTQEEKKNDTNEPPGQWKVGVLGTPEYQKTKENITPIPKTNAKGSQHMFLKGKKKIRFKLKTKSK